MGWGASAEQEKLAFVADWKRGGITMVALCAAFNDLWCIDFKGCFAAATGRAAIP